MRRGFRLLSLSLLFSLLLPSQLTAPANANPASASSASAGAVEPAAVSPGNGGGLYVPLATQARLLDTGTTPIAANTSVTSTFTGRGGLPTTGVAAVSVNITVVSPTVNGNVVAWPAGETKPGVSGVLFAANQTYASGSSILRLNASGQATFLNASTGTVRILVDVAGYYTTDEATTGGSRYVPMKQTRILDTRNRIGVPTNTAVPAKSSITFTAAGVGGLPAASAITSVAITLTALAPPAAGGMIIYPAGAVVPGVAHGNWPAGRSKSSTVVTRVAANGQVTLMNTSNSAVHFLADVTGYYTTPTNSAVASSRITTLPVAARILDTGGTTLVAAGAGRTIKVAGLGGLPATDLAAVSANLIVSGQASSGDFVAYPTGETAPVATDAIALPTHYSFNQILVRPNAAGEITILNRSNAGARIYLDAYAYAIKPKIPAAPTDVQATPADGSVKLSWTAPQDTGDQTLKAYEVTRTPGNVVTSVTGTTTTITGLTNDTAYTFKVVAVNSAGRSAAALSTAVSPAPPAPPGQPFITSVTSRDSAAAVSWDAPAGLPESITSYTVTATPGGVTMTVPGTARDALLMGLTNDTTYAITVKATNANGSGTSDPRPANPAAAKVPLAPPINAVTALNARVDVQWVRPADGGAVIDNYEVTADPGGVTQTIPADTTITALTGLTNGQEYTIKVRAHNKAGYGEPATTSSTPVAARAPGAPDDVKAAPSASGVVQLSWKAPIDIGTSAVTGYRVTVTPGGQVLDVTSPSTTVTGLDPATEYQFTVAAQNSAGTGAGTTPTAGIKPVLTTKVAPIVLTPESQQQISSLTPTAIVAATPTSQLSGLQVGQTVIADASPTTPKGFLRKITKVQTVGGLLVFNTEDAALSDVYDEMALATQFKATEDDVAAFVPAGPGIRLAAPTAGGKTRKQGGVARMKTLDDSEGKLYLKDGKLVVEVEKELELGLRITGSATLDPNFDLKVGTGLDLTSDFRLAFDTESAFRFDMTLGKKVDRRLPLGELMLRCITVGVAGAPVVICPVGSVELVLEADGRAGIAFEVTYKRRLGLDLKVTGPVVVPTAINEPIDDAFSFNHGQIVGNIAASAGMAAKFVVAFYGQGGPEIELTPYLEYEIDTAADPAAKLVFGVEIGGGLEFNFLQRKVVRWVKPDVLKFELILWDSGGPYTGLVIDPGSAEIGSFGSQQFTAGLVGFPAEPVSWRVSKGPGTIDSTGLYQATSDGLVEIEALVAANPAHGELTNTAAVKVSGFLPSEPRNVLATAGIRTADVTWDAPEFSGQNPITHYVVSTSPGTGAVTVPVTAGNRLTLRNLTPNTDYTVTVTAVNVDGVGLPGSSGTITPRTTTLSDPGGSDITDGVDGEESGIDGVVFSDSGRYAFFATKKVDRQFYLIRRDLADRSDELVSVKADGTTPEPIASAFPRVSSSSTAPNYATSGEGRYIAYRTAAGSVNQNDQIAVRDLETGEHWTTPVTPNKVSVFRLSNDGTKVTYITGNGGTANRRVYQATKGQADASWLDGCFDTKSCGSGSPLVLGVTPDGNTVMYNFETEDPASPYLTATNRVMVLDVSTGQKTMPYLNKGLTFYDPVFSSDASWIMDSVNLGDDFNPQYALVARKVGTGPFGVADVLFRADAFALDISDDGERIAWRDDNWKTYPDPDRLHVYSRSTKTNWTAPTVPGLGYYEDELVDLAPSGAAVSWRTTGQSGSPFLSEPWGAAVG